MDPNRGPGSQDSCERERSMLAFLDLTSMFTTLIQRANRANISFYPLDARGLVVFDSPIGPAAPPPPSVDAAILRDRYDAMAREYAANPTGNFTIQIQILCDPGNLDQLVRSGGSSGRDWMKCTRS